MAAGSDSDEASSSTRTSATSNEQINVDKVPYHKLFSFADKADYALMLIGAVTAVGSGLCLPLVSLLFGELANSFGQNVETRSIVDQVSKVFYILN